jgi:hypothetical protein
MKDFKIPRKEIQIFRNEIQAGWNKFQIRRNEIQIQILEFPSPNRALSRGYADPPRPLAALKAPQRRGAARSPGLFFVPLIFVSCSSGLVKQVKGWRHF